MSVKMSNFKIMKSLKLSLSLLLTIVWFSITAQNSGYQSSRMETIAGSGQFIYTQDEPGQPVHSGLSEILKGKEASINWQFTDDAAIGSRIKVSSQTGQTFTSWWLNDQRISMYGNSSAPQWEVPIISEWEWPIDMTENGEWAVTGFGNTVQVFMESTSVVFWELTVTGNVIGVKLNPEGTELFVAENNHDGQGNSSVSKYTVGQNARLVD